MCAKIFLRLACRVRSFVSCTRGMSGKIGTHNGKFHCDEVFACSLLKRLPAFKDHDIVRSRDPAVLDQCDVVVDVGGVFSHEKRRYDHHQKEFVHTMQTLDLLDFSTKLSSAGLVFAHYGKEIIAEILGLKADDRMIPVFYRKIYETYVEQIDAVDNGIPQYDGTPRYMSSGGISGRVGHLNPHWNEPDADADERFKKAMSLVGGDFEEAVKYLYNVWWPAREIVENAVDKRFDVDASGRIVLLDTESGGVPWKEHFFTIEEEKGLVNQHMCYMLFQDNTNKQWRVQAIPTNKMSAFDNRLPLPAAWRSLRDEDLSTASGIPNCVFVHTSGFIGGTKSREGAIEMARKAISIGAIKNTDNLETDAKKMKLESQSS